MGKDRERNSDRQEKEISISESFGISKRDLLKVFICICECLSVGCSYEEIIKCLNKNYLRYFAVLGILNMVEKMEGKLGKENQICK